MTAKTERNLFDIRTLAEALSRAFHDAGRSSETVAERVGCKRAYLTDAMNPHREEVQFQARMLVPFCQATDSVLPLAWLADQLGFVLVPREQAKTARDIAFEALDVASEAGELAADVRQAYSDGRLTEQERNAIRDRARRVQREAAEVERAASVSPISLTDRRHA